VLYAGAEDARRLLVDELGADFVALYRTRKVRPEEPLQGDLVVLASASAARAYGELDAAIRAISIGPETTAAAKDAGVDVVGEARTHDLDGLVDAVLAASA
jgi:uroporphyrinogen-III synthase